MSEFALHITCHDREYQKISDSYQFLHLSDLQLFYSFKNKIAKISDHDIDYLKDYALETASNYCAGCANLFEPTIDNNDVMRYLMYSRCYGEPGRAKSALKEIPPEVRGRMAGLDYQDAENKCPQGIPIGRLMQEAVIELA